MRFRTLSVLSVHKAKYESPITKAQLRKPCTVVRADPPVGAGRIFADELFEAAFEERPHDSWRGVTRGQDERVQVSWTGLEELKHGRGLGAQRGRLNIG